MGWIDYRKAYNMVPHSWVIESLHIFEKNDEVPEGGANLLFWNTRESTYKERDFSKGCAVTIAVSNCPHTCEKANPGYEFQTGETINHLLFMDDLKLSSLALDSHIQRVRIISEDIGMQFGIDKCAMLVMKKGKMVKSDGFQLPNDKVIKSLEE